MVQHLWQIIQKHLDDYGVREAEFARRIGTSPQTVNSWKQRGIHKLPDKRLLVGISDVTRRPYDEVLDAALRDTEYIPKEVVHDEQEASQASMKRAGVSPATEGKEAGGGLTPRKPRRARKVSVPRTGSGEGGRGRQR